MRARVALGSILVVVTLVAGFVVDAPVQAAPRQAAAPAVVTESSQVMLNETSVNAPGFFSYTNQPYTGSVIAWAGTDSAHRLNVMTSTDGLHYGNKITLSDSTINRPDVVQMSKDAGGAVILAWRGTDANHLLNVMFDVYGSRKKLTLRETSFTTPAITVYNGNLLLAWAGSDPKHMLNVLPISLSSFTPGTKTILTQFSGSAGPNLTVLNRGSSSELVLSWSTPTAQLNLAQSTDGVQFASALGSGLPETSPSSPDMLFFQSEGGPEYWIAWTGTDQASHVNVQWTTRARYPQWTDPAHTKSTLPELALGGTQLGFSEGLLIAWTGTDSAHHLNVARLQGF